MEMGGESPSSASDLFGILRDPKSKVVFKWLQDMGIKLAQSYQHLVPKKSAQRNISKVHSVREKNHDESFCCPPGN